MSGMFEPLNKRLVPIKPISEICAQEWAAHYWFEVTSFSDPEPVYAQGLLRTPEDAVEALKTFENFVEIQRVRIATEIERERRANVKDNHKSE